MKLQLLLYIVHMVMVVLSLLYLVFNPYIAFGVILGMLMVTYLVASHLLFRDRLSEELLEGILTTHKGKSKAELQTSFRGVYWMAASSLAGPLVLFIPVVRTSIPEHALPVFIFVLLEAAGFMVSFALTAYFALQRLPTGRI